MEITNTLFEKMLINNNISKKEFSKYSKIPYDTVVGWKKRNHVPPYAMVILKDMNYRKKLDLNIVDKLRKNNKVMLKNNYSLTKNEEKRLKSVFWGTNYTINDIVDGIKSKNQKIMKRIEENLPFNMQRQIIGKLINA
ncbi:hypothetical protein [Malaciobacter marinus]|jgi:hypothetical protein|uniref:Bacteriophage CI repressor helix-turn-helix domain-containing protein n=1 Tax=Malaciobacter marinus TaxID=505249 RepID=A0AB36ZU14_9BACT|nr:hypothetical protein [Malaciobacter marinus]PPK58677.1 hypothetical protein B0F89_13629 [Malaciobacter marinus]SKB31659.1 hypothetical protein SAMN06295997_1055 [Malaciobacter marinus]